MKVREYHAPVDIDGSEGLLAIVLAEDFLPLKNGITFITEPYLSQQVGLMSHSKGHIIPAHRHCEVSREVKQTQEVLIVRKGLVKVDLYTSEKRLAHCIMMLPGDMIILIAGGHGFEMMEDSEMAEIKQGPYSADNDKVRF